MLRGGGIFGGVGAGGDHPDHSKIPKNQKKRDIDRLNDLMIECEQSGGLPCRWRSFPKIKNLWNRRLPGMVGGYFRLGMRTKQIIATINKPSCISSDHSTISVHPSIKSGTTPPPSCSRLYNTLLHLLCQEKSHSLQVALSLSKFNYGIIHGLVGLFILSSISLLLIFLILALCFSIVASSTCL